MPLSSHGPRRVGRYLLCDQIGSGGMATIHLARLIGPEGFSRTVAVKQLHPQFAQNPQFVAMLLDEARLAVRVRHVNVVSPLDIVVTDGELFIVMDYVSGESFANLLVAAAAPLQPGLAAAILVQVLLGLHAAHEATREQGEALGLVHRDVSPQNILVGQDGVSRVLDFGIAKAVARAQTTDGGMVKGKLGYMAPEQIKLEAVDRRTDLFSAGVVLWEALTGQGLFVADTLGGSIELITRGQIAPPSRHNPLVTPELDAVVLKALERDRDARYEDALSMAAALERATSLASALEVIDWVETLAGSGLARRAELVRRAEALASEPVEVPSPPASTPLSDEPVAPSARGRSDRVSVPTRPFAGPLRRDPPAQSAGHALGSHSMATSESTGVAVGSDRDARAVAEDKGGRQWRSVGLALGIVLAGSAVALGVVSMSKSEPQRSFASVEPPLASEPRPAVAVTAPPLPARSAAAAEPLPSAPRVRPTSSASTATLSLRAQPAADEEEGAPPAARTRSGRRAPSAAAARRSAAKAASAPGASKGEKKKAGRKLVETDDGAPPRASAGECDPPWVINEQNIKIFKVQCVR